MKFSCNLRYSWFIITHSCYSTVWSNNVAKLHNTAFVLLQTVWLVTLLLPSLSSSSTFTIDLTLRMSSNRKVKKRKKELIVIHQFGITTDCKSLITWKKSKMKISTVSAFLYRQIIFPFHFKLYANKVFFLLDEFNFAADQDLPHSLMLLKQH